jgi:hypothetical protein
MTNKAIDINQRIPLNALHIALESYLNGTYSPDYILEQLQFDFKGENRIKKAQRIIEKIITRSPLEPLLSTNREQVLSALKSKSDRSLILIALLNSAFPFSYDVLSVFGRFFTAQELVNIDTIRNAVFKIYGGNRAPDIGFYSVVPMFLEAGFFSRPKPGMYAWSGKLAIRTTIAKDIYFASFKLNNSIDTIQDYQLMDPYFIFIGEGHE